MSTTPTEPAVAPIDAAVPPASTAPGANPDPSQDPAKGISTDWEKHARTWETRARGNQAELTQMREQWSRLASVFAPEASDPKPDDMVRALSERLDASELRASVNDLARTYGIKSDEDVALLRSIPDVQQREALAQRLKPADGQPAPIPPDPGQGPRNTSAPTDDAEFNQYFPSEK